MRRFKFCTEGARTPHNSEAGGRKQGSEHRSIRSQSSDTDPPALGDHFGLRAFGVNLTRLAAGDVSALHHGHSVQDEFVYVLEGHPTLVTEGGEVKLSPGMCAGFPANGPAHHLENRTEHEVLVLEVGDRAPGDQVVYPADDLMLIVRPDGKRHFAHKDGTPY